jgi:hypothetical protein
MALTFVATPLNLIVMNREKAPFSQSNCSVNAAFLTIVGLSNDGLLVSLTKDHEVNWHDPYLPSFCSLLPHFASSFVQS